MPPTASYRPDPRHPALGEAFYDAVEAAPFPAEILRFRNDRWAARVGLDGLTDREWIAHFARFDPLPDNLTRPLALRYHGHQFRAYNPDLGDGRGFLYAQLRDDDGRLLDLGTKGSGRTPWSRGGDGRLTLKGGVREVLATEMLEAQGVYTSKTFSLVETGEALQRNDEPSPTRSSVLVRLSHGHIRIGTFQRLAAHDQIAEMRRLVDHCIAFYWPAAAEAADPVAGLFAHVITAVAETAADWWVAGFVHGVLNTDNTAITGESFDYGPWRFLPTLDPRFTAAYFDHSGLYSFGRQADSLYWNCERLASCLLELSNEAALTEALRGFEPAFWHRLVHRTCAKLGIASGDEQTDEIVRCFYEALHQTQIGYERCFFDLVGGARPERVGASPHRAAYAQDVWAPVLSALRNAPPTPATAALLDSAPLAADEPCTMLTADVEEIWDRIAEDDDWAPFEAKVRAIRDWGDAYRLLLPVTGPSRHSGGGPAA
ncbi:MAG: YdiU family protein [Alphaproteobacteria bacterium]|nr:YdiU family protein [Alphaproteobacteria bacterium]